jgi:hypothetical protein
MPDPIIIQWLLLGAAAFCAGMMGYNYGKQKDETIINDTIVYLIENDFIHARKTNGEWEIIPLNEN